MKTAEYFTSPEFNMWEVEKAIDAARSKKGRWIENNINQIAAVESEEIFFNAYGSQNEKVFITIKLNYYPVEK